MNEKFVLLFTKLLAIIVSETNQQISINIIPFTFTKLFFTREGAKKYDVWSNVQLRNRPPVHFAIIDLQTFFRASEGP
jgi:hypothetical protein